MPNWKRPYGEMVNEIADLRATIDTLTSRLAIAESDVDMLSDKLDAAEQERDEAKEMLVSNELWAETRERNRALERELGEARDLLRRWRKARQWAYTALDQLTDEALNHTEEAQ